MSIIDFAQLNEINNINLHIYATQFVWNNKTSEHLHCPKFTFTSSLKLLKLTFIKDTYSNVLMEIQFVYTRWRLQRAHLAYCNCCPVRHVCWCPSSCLCYHTKLFSYGCIQPMPFGSFLLIHPVLDYWAIASFVINKHQSVYRNPSPLLKSTSRPLCSFTHADQLVGSNTQPMKRSSHYIA